MTHLGLSRRTLLKAAAAAVAGPYILSAASRGRAGSPPPSERIALGLIGLGSMGLRHVKGFLEESDCRIVALCDLDAKRLAEAADVVRRAYGADDVAHLHDFRDAIARRDVDALCIAVPDHWHAIPAIQAARAGKHIYGEKPLALTVPEGRAMVREVARAGIVWETGSWQRSTAQFRQACELVRNGRVGRLQRVEVGCGDGPVIGPQPLMPVPEGFDYDFWLGPAPDAPYTEKRCHWNFRWILDYSGGQITDWGAHNIDIAHWGMNADATGPVEVEGRGDFPAGGLWDSVVRYRFTCRYADGVVMDVASTDVYPTGIKFIGDRGWVYVDRAKITSDPAGIVREKIGPEEIHLSSPRGNDRQGHRRDFLDCVRTVTPTVSPIEAAQRSVTVCHLANIAMLLGRKVRWNPEREEVVDDPEAARMLGRPMRGAWHL